MRTATWHKITTGCAHSKMAKEIDRLCAQQHGTRKRQVVRTATWHMKTTGCAHSKMAQENDRLCAQQHGTRKRQAVHKGTAQEGDRTEKPQRIR